MVGYLKIDHSRIANAGPSYPNPYFFYGPKGRQGLQGASGVAKSPRPVPDLFLSRHKSAKVAEGRQWAYVTFCIILC